MAERSPLIHGLRPVPVVVLLSFAIWLSFPFALAPHAFWLTRSFCLADFSAAAFAHSVVDRIPTDAVQRASVRVSEGKPKHFLLHTDCCCVLVRPGTAYPFMRGGARQRADPMRTLM